VGASEKGERKRGAERRIAVSGWLRLSVVKETRFSEAGDEF